VCETGEVNESGGVGAISKYDWRKIAIALVESRIVLDAGLTMGSRSVERIEETLIEARSPQRECIRFLHRGAVKEYKVIGEGHDSRRIVI
jgi:hypothetical protein